MISLKVILDKRKPKVNGTCAVYYLITKKKKVFYLYTGFSILPTQWDEQKNQVKKSHINAQTINTSISKKYFEIQKAIVELADEELFSIESLKEKISPNHQINTVKEFSDMLVKSLFAKGKTGNALA